jgi:hypothetical protein
MRKNQFRVHSALQKVRKISKNVPRIGYQKKFKKVKKVARVACPRTPSRARERARTRDHVRAHLLNI